MTRWGRSATICVALAAVPALVAAQRGGGGARRQLPPDQQGRGIPPAQRIMQALRNQLQLSDAQAAKVAEVARRYGERRQGINEEERQARTTIHDVVCNADTARQAELSHSLDALFDIQKRRAQLLEDEQHELTPVLTPFQRARYLGFEERLADVFGRGGPPVRPGRMGGANRGGPPPGGSPPNGPPPGGPPPGMGPPGGDVCANPPPGRGS